MINSTSFIISNCKTFGSGEKPGIPSLCQSEEAILTSMYPCFHSVRKAGSEAHFGSKPAIHSFGNACFLPHSFSLGMSLVFITVLSFLMLHLSYSGYDLKADEAARSGFGQSQNGNTTYVALRSRMDLLIVCGAMETRNELWFLKIIRIRNHFQTSNRKIL